MNNDQIGRFETHSGKWEEHIPVIVDAQWGRDNAWNTPLLCYSLGELLEAWCAISSGDVEVLLMGRDLHKQSFISR